jgi:hypothetical protein
MLKKTIFTLLAVWIIMQAFPAGAQNYDYHREESPSVSWNNIPMFDARMLAVGGISLMASDAFSAVINPAAIPAAKGLITGGSFQAVIHQAFQYWGLNQGVFYTNDPQTQENYRPGGFALTVPVKKFRFSGGWYTVNLLELPRLNFADSGWSFKATFPGVENAVFAAAAWKWGKNLSMGLKLDYIFAYRNVDTEEIWPSVYTTTYRHRESHRMACLVPSLGAKINISPRWTLGTLLVYPLRGKAHRTLDHIFDSPSTHLEIANLKSTDNYYRPARVYLGAIFTPFAHGEAEGSGKNKLTLAAEILYTAWSGYHYVFYSETLARPMRNTLTAALGLEYSIYNPSSVTFFRLGYRLDPQPITEPRTTLQELTGGFGLEFGRLNVDVGALYCFGSPGGIMQKHFVLNSTVQFHW